MAIGVLLAVGVLLVVAGILAGSLPLIALAVLTLVSAGILEAYGRRRG